MDPLNYGMDLFLLGIPTVIESRGRSSTALLSQVACVYRQLVRPPPTRGSLPMTGEQRVPALGLAVSQQEKT